MAQRQNSYTAHDLPPPPPAHHAQYQHPHVQDAHQQQQQQQHQQDHYYQEPSSPQDDNSTQRPASLFHRQQSASQASTGAQQPPSSRHSNSKSRSFSFHSDKHKRTTSKSEHEHYQESSAEKEARRLHSKADPTLAMSEAEPSMEAAMMHSSLAPLRAIQHKDAFGNTIADPDKSNPTRNRWERPLDTVRSFEAAIDGGYRRKSTVRSDTDSVAHWNRRSSYHPSAQFGPSSQGNQGRARTDSYFAGHASRPVSFRPESTQFSLAGPQTARSSMYGEPRGYPDGGYGDYGPGPSRQRMPRMQTEPPFGPPHGRDVYRLAHKDRSYETVTSAEGSGNSDQIGYQTDPTSSDNSSIERRSPAKRQEPPPNDYGIGFGPSQSYGNSNQAGADNSGPPLPPHASRQPAGRSEVVRKEAPSLLKRQSTQQSQPSPAPEKRKSWLARRFSKKD